MFNIISRNLIYYQYKSPTILMGSAVQMISVLLLKHRFEHAAVGHDIEYRFRSI